MIRIVLVDRQVMVRQALRLLIETRSACQVVGEAAAPEEVLALTCEHRPDIVVLGLDSGTQPIVELIPRLLDACDVARILILADRSNPQLHQQALQAGALGIVHKEKSAETLLKAISKIYEGEAWIDRSMTASLLVRKPAKPDPEATKIAQLTSRERQIVQLVADGLRGKEIASRLVISEATLRNHLTSIFSKLEVVDRLGMLIYALRHGLAKPPERVP